MRVIIVCLAIATIWACRLRLAETSSVASTQSQASYLCKGREKKGYESDNSVFRIKIQDRLMTIEHVDDFGKKDKIEGYAVTSNDSIALSNGSEAFKLNMTPNYISLAHSQAWKVDEIKPSTVIDMADDRLAVIGTRWYVCKKDS